MKSAPANLGIAVVIGTLGAIACRQGDPGLDPKTPPNSPLPKLDRPDDSPESPQPDTPRLTRDGG